MTLLVVALLVAPVAHFLHDFTRNDCRLCELRQSDDAVLPNVLAFAEHLKPTVRIDCTVIACVEPTFLLTISTRAPPA